ncbi:MAG: sorbosone dehydrogenase family protein [Acidobacteria bacterium]|nr:sorbosone dehydrogenase family protein [Acidobacteriota bacterium]
MPVGFELTVFAEGVGRARFMAFGPDGVLYVGSNSDKVYALPDRNRDARADEVIVFASGLHTPHSVAWRDGWLYVGETHRVIRLRDTDGDLRADETQVVVGDLPAGEMHFTRTVGFGPASAKAPAGQPDGALYVSVGSSCNVCREADERRAAILRLPAEALAKAGFNPDSFKMEIFSRGLRNAVGFTWQPETGDLWATDNGRDWLGDDLPPDELNLVRRGEDHGWPYCYGNRVPDPEMGSPERCAGTVPATFELPAHSAALGLEFYTGAMFPPAYRGDLFIAFHGSWNRSVPTGYKVVRVRFKDGRPVAMEDFVDVWLKGGRVHHRPVDVKTGPDGALYISDDRGATSFRVTYQK